MPVSLGCLYFLDRSSPPPQAACNRNEWLFAGGISFSTMKNARDERERHAIEMWDFVKRFLIWLINPVFSEFPLQFARECSAGRTSAASHIYYLR